MGTFFNSLLLSVTISVELSIYILLDFYIVWEKVVNLKKKNTSSSVGSSGLVNIAYVKVQIKV